MKPKMTSSFRVRLMYSLREGMGISGPGVAHEETVDTGMVT